MRTGRPNGRPRSLTPEQERQVYDRITATRRGKRCFALAEMAYELGVGVSTLERIVTQHRVRAGLSIKPSLKTGNWSADVVTQGGLLTPKEPAARSTWNDDVGSGVAKPCSRCGNPRDRRGQKYCRACHNAYMREHRVKPSDFTDDQRRKFISRSIASRAQRRGQLQVMPCETCGGTENIEKHHQDYRQPLVVRWLCRRCHLLEHGKTSNHQNSNTGRTP